MINNLFPKKIVSSSNILNVDSFLQEDFLQVDISPNGAVFLKNNDYIVFDFGKEISGGIRILTTGMSNDGEVRIRFGESLSEANAEIGEESGATNDHSPRDFKVKMPCLSDLVFGQTGFRFVRLDFSGEYWGVQHIVASLDIDDREEVGQFNCDDSLLKEIWDTASYTIRLNLHNGLIWDGVKRDRLCWIGDAYNEIKAVECLYSKQDEIKNILDFSKNSVLDIVNESKTFLPSTYCIWWLLVLIEKYKHDGDKQYFTKNIDFVGDILTYINKFIINGVVILPMNFIDWPSHPLGTNTEEDLIKLNDEKSGVTFLVSFALQQLKEVCKDFDCILIKTKTTEILNKINVDALSIHKFKQNAALGIAANSCNKELINIVKKDGAHGFSTFCSYLILKSLAKNNEHDLALSCLKEYYGKMLELGATSFFEDFDIDWSINAGRIDEPLPPGKIDFHLTYGQFCYKKLRHSLAHGWGSGVIPYIVEEIVGLKEIAPNEFILNPHLSSLKNVSYIYPHKLGNIIIKINRDNESINVSLDHPKDVVIKNVNGELYE